MTIPRIRPYAMPRAEQLPVGRAPWTPDPERGALLIHDLQEYFLDFFERESAPIPELLANVRALTERARERGVPIVYTTQPGAQSPAERGLLSDLWGPGITASRDRTEIVELVSPRDGDHVLTKWRYSAFQRTELLELLRRLGRDQLFVTGVYAHIGCLLTTAEAFMNDIEPFFVADAVADFSEEHHRMAVAHVAGCCGALATTSALLASLGVSPPRAYDAVAREVAALLGVDATELDPHEPLLELGLDSLRIMALVERWRARGIEVSFVELAERPTLANFARLFA